MKILMYYIHELQKKRQKQGTCGKEESRIALEEFSRRWKTSTIETARLHEVRDGNSLDFGSVGKSGVKEQPE